MTQYVYRLVVVVPPASLTDPEWRPASWDEHVAEIGYDPFGGYDDGPLPWKWPHRLTYLSGSAATTRANLLRGCGAEVVILRSDPVTFPVSAEADRA